MISKKFLLKSCYMLNPPIFIGSNAKFDATALCYISPVPGSALQPGGSAGPSGAAVEGTSCQLFEMDHENDQLINHGDD
jgi:hypothetical protein